jgi:hypothetical protein
MAKPHWWIYPSKTARNSPNANFSRAQNGRTTTARTTGGKMRIVKTIARKLTDSKATGHNLTGHKATGFRTKGRNLIGRVMIARVMIDRVMIALVRNALVRNGFSKVTAPVKIAVKIAVQHPHRNCVLKMVRQTNVRQQPQFLNLQPLSWHRSQKPPHLHPLQRQSRAHRVQRNPWHLPRPKASLTSN